MTSEPLQRNKADEDEDTAESRDGDSGDRNEADTSTSQSADTRVEYIEMEPVEIIGTAPARSDSTDSSPEQLQRNLEAAWRSLGETGQGTMYELPDGSGTSTYVVTPDGQAIDMYTGQRLPDIEAEVKADQAKDAALEEALRQLEGGGLSGGLPKESPASELEKEAGLTPPGSFGLPGLDGSPSGPGTAGDNDPGGKSSAIDDSPSGQTDDGLPDSGTGWLDSDSSDPFRGLDQSWDTGVDSSSSQPGSSSPGGTDPGDWNQWPGDSSSSDSAPSDPPLVNAPGVTYENTSVLSTGTTVHTWIEVSGDGATATIHQTVTDKDGNTTTTSREIDQTAHQEATQKTSEEGETTVEVVPPEEEEEGSEDDEDEEESEDDGEGREDDKGMPNPMDDDGSGGMPTPGMKSEAVDAMLGSLINPVNPSDPDAPSSPGGYEPQDDPVRDPPENEDEVPAPLEPIEVKVDSLINPINPSDPDAPGPVSPEPVNPPEPIITEAHEAASADGMAGFQVAAPTTAESGEPVIARAVESDPIMGAASGLGTPDEAEALAGTALAGRGTLEFQATAVDVPHALASVDLDDSVSAEESPQPEQDSALLLQDAEQLVGTEQVNTVNSAELAAAAPQAEEPPGLEMPVEPGGE